MRPITLIYVSDHNLDVRASHIYLNPSLHWIQSSEFASDRLFLRKWFINSRSGLTLWSTP